MRPLMVINGILLGSCLSIAVSLGLVLIVFVVLGDDYPRVQHEFRPLVSSLSIFFVMTIISAGSFYTLAREHRLWLPAQGLLWLGLAGTGWYFWP